MPHTHAEGLDSSKSIYAFRFDERPITRGKQQPSEAIAPTIYLPRSVAGVLMTHLSLLRSFRFPELTSFT